MVDLFALAKRSYMNRIRRYVSLPAQIIDGDGRSGMIGGRVFTAVPGDGLFNGMIIRAVFFMQGPMLSGFVVVAKLRMDRTEVVMCGKVFRVYLQCLVKPVPCLLQHIVLLLATQWPTALIQGAAQFIQYSDIVGKIEAALPGI